MPRPQHAQGRPGTQVVPHDWEATHRPVAEKTMTATIALAHPPTGQTWDPDLKQMVANTGQPYWTGPCRIQELAVGARQDLVTAEDPETLGAYLVTVPADVTPTDMDRGTVTAIGDPALEGQVLTVQRITRGSLRFERDLTCTLTT